MKVYHQIYFVTFLVLILLKYFRSKLLIFENEILLVIVNSLPNFFGSILLILFSLHIIERCKIIKEYYTYLIRVCYLSRFIPHLMTFLLLTVYEIVQLTMPNRTYDTYDILFTFIGCVIMLPVFSKDYNNVNENQTE